MKRRHSPGRLQVTAPCCHEQRRNTCLLHAMEIPQPPCYTPVWTLTIQDLRNLLQRKLQIGLTNEKPFLPPPQKKNKSKQLLFEKFAFHTHYSHFSFWKVLLIKNFRTCRTSILTYFASWEKKYNGFNADIYKNKGFSGLDFLLLLSSRQQIFVQPFSVYTLIP